LRESDISIPFELFFAPAIWLGWLLDATVMPYLYG
jgi:hypothetical protein